MLSKPSSFFRLNRLAALFLIIEFFDEFIDGFTAIAWPAIRSEFGLSYVQIGLLLSAPFIVGCLAEIGLGVLADRGYRSIIVRLGGAAFAAALLGIALAPNFTVLFAAFVLFNPASGAFVSLAQTALMDRFPGRRERMMVCWTASGEAAHFVAPVIYLALAAHAGGWRWGFALIALLILPLIAATGRERCDTVCGASDNAAPRFGLSETFALFARWEIAKWVIAIDLANLLLDVFSGFLALYLVDALGMTATQAAALLFVRSIAAFAGEGLVIVLLSRMDGVRYLKLSASAAGIAYLLFITATETLAIYLLVMTVSLCTSGWYAVLKANLYDALPGQSGIVISIRAIAGFVAAVVPFLLGLIAERWGISVTMSVLAAGPLAVLFVAWEHSRSRPVSASALHSLDQA